MKTSRRKFLKRGALFVPSAFAILQARAQVSLSSPGFVDQLIAPVAAGGCSTVRDSYTTDADVFGQIAATAGNKWVAFKVFAGSGPFSYCKLELDLFKNGSPTGNLTGYIYSHNSTDDCPDALIGSGSGNVDASTLPAAYNTSWTAFDVSATPASYPFWMVLTKDSVSFSDNVRIGRKNAGGDMRWVEDADGLGIWNLESARQARFRLYSA